MWMLNVKEKYYNMLKQGTKTIELRLFDDKRKNIKVADIIKFSNISNAEDTFWRKLSNYIEPITLKNYAIRLIATMLVLKQIKNL